MSATHSWHLFVVAFIRFMKNDVQPTTRRSEYLSETSGVVREAVARTLITMIVETPFQSAYDTSDPEVIHFYYELLMLRLHYS